MSMGTIWVAATLLIGATASSAFAKDAPKPGATFRDCADCSEMVVIGPGTFQMGAEGGEPERYEGPVHAIRIDYSFAVGVIPVTNAQFGAFIKDSGHKAAKDCWVPLDGTYKEIEGSSWADPAFGRPPRDDEPVVCIDWRDARAYVEWLAKKTGQPYRLLSEAEWEYVARAGTTTRFPWGDDPEEACKHSNLLDASASRKALVVGEPTKCSDGYATLAPAGSFAPNAFGVRDMIGNVWTWAQDCYVMPYAADTPTDGSAYEGGKCDRRSVKGASWATTTLRARPTFRGRDPETLVSQLFGVRVARDLK